MFKLNSKIEMPSTWKLAVALLQLGVCVYQDKYDRKRSLSLPSA